MRVREGPKTEPGLYLWEAETTEQEWGGQGWSAEGGEQTPPPAFPPLLFSLPLPFALP